MIFSDQEQEVELNQIASQHVEVYKKKIADLERELG